MALSENDALTKIRRRDLAPYKIREISSDLETKITLFIFKPKTKDLVIFSRQFSVMISAGVPVVVAAYGLILPPRNMSTWRMVDTVFRQHEVPYTVAMEAGGWEIVKKYVEMGLGVSIVTEVCLTGNEKVKAVPLHDYFPARSYGLIVRRGKFFSPQAKRFIEMFDENFFMPT